ncbi:MAG: hypothetical protein IKC63_04825 [Clostridia bacterium]|nr:hypothetical protein [Clostridia bacterium]
MTENEKIQYAKAFIDKLARGINPLDDSVIRDDDIVNNVRISRCFFYVSELLDRLINQKNTSNSSKKSEKKKELSMTEEAKRVLKPFQVAKHQTDLTAYINSFVDPSGKKMKSGIITEWLESLGMLTVSRSDDGKKLRYPTKEGIDVGFFTEHRVSSSGKDYYVFMFSPTAQQFVFDNIDSLIEYQNLGIHETTNEASDWTAEDDQRIKEMSKKGKSLSAIAKSLKRSIDSTLTRMKKLGIVS